MPPFAPSYSGTELSYDRIGRAFDLMLPEPEHLISARGHVRVLRGVAAHPFLLAFVGVREPVGVAMPVVAVELDDKAVVRQERVHAELVTNEVLFDVARPHLVEQFVSPALKPVDAGVRLPLVHVDEHGLALRVRVPAGKRTVFDVVLAGRRARGGPPELHPADDAGVRGLVATLPCVRTRLVAEVPRTSFAVLVDSERLATPRAGCVEAALVVGVGGPPIARRGAVPLLRSQVPRVCLPASSADDGAYFIPLLSLHTGQVNHDSGTVNPIEVN